MTGGVLLLTALAKLYSATGHAKLLVQHDHLLHLDYRPLMVLAALVEILVAAFLLRSRSDLKRSLAML